MTRTSCGSLWLAIAGARCALTCAGALWLPAARALVAGDLHLEKGSAYAAKGSLLPPYDTRETLSALERELERLKPRTLVLLGDSFHDPRALARLQSDDALRLAALARGRDVVWVEGNHDRKGEATALAALPGLVCDEVEIDGLTLRHEPRPGPQPGEVSGHLHPSARVVSRGRAVRRRCFLTDGERLILPAFGAYAGGLNARDAAFAGLFRSAPLAAVLGRERVRAIPYAALWGDSISDISRSPS